MNEKEGGKSYGFESRSVPMKGCMQIRNVKQVVSKAQIIGVGSKREASSGWIWTDEKAKGEPRMLGYLLPSEGRHGFAEQVKHPSFHERRAYPSVGRFESPNGL